MMSSQTRFLRLIPSAPAPIRADATASGTMAIRAFRYCEPIRLATALGWYIFPPIDFSVIWDGVVVKWKCDGLDEWITLDAVQFPKFASYFDSKCPEDIRGYSPPFVSSVVQPGVIQVWSGLVVQTAPGWYSYVRSPINLPKSRHATSFEGVIETDNWFGPLFSNFQIDRMNEEVRFKRSEPMFTVVIVPEALVKDKTLQNAVVEDGIDDLSPEDWAAYRRTIVERVGANRVTGSYAVRSRKS